MLVVKLYVIALARHWWWNGIITNDAYDWFLGLIHATPLDIYLSPFIS